MQQNFTLGIFLSLFGAFIYSSQTAVIKSFAASLSLPQIVFMQSLVGLIIFLPFVFKNGVQSAKKILTTRKLPIHLFRAVSSLGLSYFLFAAVKHMPLVNALLLANTAPLILPFIGFIFFSQPINHRSWLPLMVGFIGIILVLHPEGHLFNNASFLALAAAFFMAAGMLIVQHLAVTESAQTITFYFFLFTTIISGIVALPSWTQLSLILWVALAVIGVLYLACQYVMTHAARFINAQLIGMLFYSNILFAMLISLLRWHILPGPTALLGVALTIFGGIFCIRAEYLHRRLHKGVVQDVK